MHTPRRPPPAPLLSSPPSDTLLCLPALRSRAASVFCFSPSRACLKAAWTPLSMDPLRRVGLVPRVSRALGPRCPLEPPARPGRGAWSQRESKRSFQCPSFQADPGPQEQELGSRSPAPGHLSSPTRSPPTRALCPLGRGVALPSRRVSGLSAHPRGSGQGSGWLW